MVNTQTTAPGNPLAGVARLDSLGAVRVHGQDAEHFLNAQLTNTVPAADGPGSCLAGWCDAKGRVEVLFRVLRVAQDDFVLMLPVELIPALLPRLRMFVLRARVTIADTSDETTLFGIVGDAASTLAAGDALPSEPNACGGIADGTLMRLPAANPLYLALGGERLSTQLGSSAALDENRWALAVIRAGLPAITAATRSKFVPQMLNLHWLGGLDFDKGCYPGQEVVARLQFRGTLKRRVYRAETDGEAAPGETVYSGQASAGTVLQSAGTPEGGCELLAVIEVDAAARTLTVNNSPLRLLALPYPTPD